MPSKYPSEIDDDESIERIDDNLSEISGDVTNALRDAVFSIETEVGIGASGSTGSIANRLGVSFAADGYILPSSLVGLGLVSLPITNDMISATAGIEESKLSLHYTTTNLYNLYTILNNAMDVVNGFISLTGIKLEPHIDGTAYNHLLQAIHVDPAFIADYQNRFLVNRNTTNLNTLLLDINSDISSHERADGTSPPTPFAQPAYTTFNGEIVPSNFAHAASGIHIDSSTFATIPQSVNDVQSFAEFADNSSLLLLGSRVQTLYSNGIPRTSRSTVLGSDGYAEALVPPTSITAFLAGVPPGPTSSTPVDDINFGDDIVLFNPSADTLSSSTFDAQFTQVKSGDVLTINYGNGIAGQFAIDSIKSIINGTTRVYAVRIIGKNLHSTTDGYARIDKSLFHNNKYGVVSSARAPALNSSGQNAINQYESLIITSPKGATATGTIFNASQFDTGHYNLYLSLYPTGNPNDLVVNLPAIDATGNKGKTPGTYTIENIVNALNVAFRAPGYNYRFNAFQYQGSIGIMLADAYNNASFSIIGGLVDGYGNYTAGSNSSYPSNVIDTFNNIDPLGMGGFHANVASPPFALSYSTPKSAKFAPTLIFFPLKKKFYYVDGVERDSLKSDPNFINQIVDKFGDGYWPATISNVSVGGSTVATSYSIPLDLSSSGLMKGKTIVIQPSLLLTDPGYSSVDYGRFIIQNVAFTGCDTANPITTITVYDAIHGIGVSPYVSSTNIAVRVYFSDDSVEFDAANVFDQTSSGSYKRFFEVYVDANGKTFTHERGRFLLDNSAGISNINIYSISPKLRGYATSNDNEIRLVISSFSNTTGIFEGYLCRFNPSIPSNSNLGATVVGRKGEIVRFYDETNIDYIDFVFNINDTIATFPGTEQIDIQLFGSLEINEQFMLLSSCQVSDNTKLVSYLKDERQFGNVSEEQLSTSAIDFINANSKYTEQNGVVRGFDFISSSANSFVFSGGVSIVNGRTTLINGFSISIPLVQDNNSGSPIPGILWALCANKNGDVELVALTDFNINVNTINNPNRILQLFNTVNSQIYYVYSSTFADIVNNRKDLTILWLFNSQVSNSTTYTITQSDARKYVSDANANTNLVLTSDTSQGNFKTISSLASWGLYNLNLQSIATVRGSSTVGNAVIPPYINFNGDGYVSEFIFNNSSSLSHNNFSNIKLTINSTVNFTQCNFNNCNLILSSTTNLSNCNFYNCTITISSTSNISQCVFDNCTITDTAITAFEITSTSSNTKFVNCIINYFPSSSDVISSANYTGSNFVNNGNAFLHCNVDSVDNITVNNCIFNFLSSIRYSAINFEFSSLTNIAQNISISKNKFYTLSGSEDVRSVISFVCTLVSGDTTAEGMKLVNCSIDNNICNMNQMIAITTIQSGSALNNAITPVSSKINGNICGTISIIGRSDTARNYISVSSYARDKNYGIEISENTCKYIATLNSLGQLISFGNTYQFTSCSVMLQKNNCSWIHLIGVVNSNNYTKAAMITASNNNLRAYDTAYYTQFGGTINAAILLNRKITNPYAVITNNVITTGQYVDVSNNLITYDYDNALYSMCDSVIDGNIFDGLNASGDMIKISSVGSVITNNKFVRNSTSINSYVNLSIITSGNHTITDNAFDSDTVDGSSTVLVANQSYFTIFTRNKNQTEYTILSLDSNFSTINNSLNYNEYADGTPLVINPNGLSFASTVFFGANFNTTTKFADSSTDPRFVRMKSIISNVLPEGARILDIQMGVFMSNVNSAIVSSSSFAVNLSRLASPTLTNLTDAKSLAANGITYEEDITVSPINVITATYPPLAGSMDAGAVSALQANNQLIDIDLTNYTDLSSVNHGDVSKYFLINKRFPIVLTFEMLWQQSAGTTSVYLSPIKIKYTF